MESPLCILMVIVVVIIESHAVTPSDTVKEPTGPGVCTALQVDSKRSTITEYKIQAINVSYFCLQNFKFQCYFQTEKIIPVKVEKVTQTYKTVSKCCDGYGLTENGLHCKPVCENQCVWGKCILPNMCLCDKYYDGPTCEEHSVCPSGRFGPDCKQKCQCKNNGTCNPFDGTCHCQTGYTGNYCESQCWMGYYGDDCRNKCDCPSGNTCNPIDGNCTYKQTTQPTCPPDYYGPKCLNKCKCQNNAECNSENGNCICQAGYIGSECESECPPGYFGFNCLGVCDCRNGSLCDPQTGYCLCESDDEDDCNDMNCPAGFYGTTCSKVCPPKFYGEMCSKICNCDATLCDPARGCIYDSNDSFTSFIHQEKKEKSKSEISNILVVLTLVCILALLITMIVYSYFYCNTRKSNEANEDNAKLQNSINVKVKSAISMLSSGKFLKSSMVDSKNTNTSHLMDGFHKDFSFSHDNYGYNTTENLYLEIDEGIVDNTEDVYDHLDFLRPAKPWKPHYQKPLVMQEQKINSGSNYNNNSSQLQQKES